MARIYVASSWRNKYQQAVVEGLRNHGHSVYDFKNPGGGLKGEAQNQQIGFTAVGVVEPTRVAPELMGFQWDQLDPKWKDWTGDQYRAAVLGHPIASHSFTADFRAMRWADTCVLVLPSGRSAHLEAGFMAGAGKRTILYTPTPEKVEPELMNLLLDDFVTDFDQLLKVLDQGTIARRLL